MRKWMNIKFQFCKTSKFQISAVCIVLIVTMLYCALKSLFKKVYFMLSFLTTQQNNKKQKQGGMKNLLEVMNIFIILIVLMVCRDTHMSKLINLCTLNSFSLFVYQLCFSNLFNENIHMVKKITKNIWYILLRLHKSHVKIKKRLFSVLQLKNHDSDIVNESIQATL